MPLLSRVHGTALGFAVRLASLAFALGACGDDEGAHQGGASDGGNAATDAGATVDDAGLRTEDAMVGDDASPPTMDAASQPVEEPDPVTPAFTQMPLDQEVTEGAAAVFSATVVGDPAPTLQWQRSDDDGASWSDIAGATSASYETGAVTMTDHGARFRLVAENSAGSATTDAARLSVTAAEDATAPVFEEDPAYTVVGAGTPVHLSVKATGQPAPSYQWQMSNDRGASWSDIVGATGSSYHIAAAAMADVDPMFRVIASNSAGSTTSNQAMLVVCVSGPLTVTHDPSFWDYAQFRRGTGGIFCPRSGAIVGPHASIPGAVSVNGLIETGMTSTQEALAFSYDPATGAVIDLSYYLETPTIKSTWLCSVGSSYYKPCQGVHVDATGGQISFIDTVVGEESGNFAIVLNGSLSFAVP